MLVSCVFLKFGTKLVTVYLPTAWRHLQFDQGRKPCSGNDVVSYMSHSDIFLSPRRISIFLLRSPNYSSAKKWPHLSGSTIPPCSRNRQNYAYFYIHIFILLNLCSCVLPSLAVLLQLETLLIWRGMCRCDLWSRHRMS